MKTTNDKRKVVIGTTETHEVEFSIHPLFGFRFYVDGQRVHPKKKFELLELTRTFKISVGEAERHDVEYRLAFRGKYWWECTILVDGNGVRQFDDSYFGRIEDRFSWRRHGGLLIAVLVAFLALLFAVSHFFPHR